MMRYGRFSGLLMTVGLSIAGTDEGRPSECDEVAINGRAPNGSALSRFYITHASLTVAAALSAPCTVDRNLNICAAIPYLHQSIILFVHEVITGCTTLGRQFALASLHA